MLQQLWLRAVVGGVLVAVVGAGIPVMVSAQTGPVINACVNKITGIVRIVPDGTNCQRNETAYTWNVQGPAGPAGPSGAAHVVAEGRYDSGGEITQRDNFLYAGPEFKTPIAMRCSVSVTTGIWGGGTGPQPMFQIAVKLNGADGNDSQWGGYFPKPTGPDQWLVLERHRWVDVFNDQTVQFGAYIGEAAGDWLPLWCAVSLQYVCFER